MFTFTKTIKHLGLLAAAILVLISVAQAAETVSLKGLIQQLLQQNPQIQAAQSKYEAALARPGQQRALPDPMVSFITKNGSGNPVPFTKLGSDPLSSAGIMWEQEIPYPGKLKLAGKIAEKEADSAGADIDAVRWVAISEIKQSYYEYFRADRSLEVLQESMDFLKQMESISESQYSVGKAIQQDVLRAQLEISILTQRITTLEQEKASAAAAINRLLNNPMDSPLAAPADVRITRISEPLDTLLKEDAATSPMVRSSSAMLDHEKLNLDLAKKQKRPDFMAAVEYDNSPNFPDMWEIRLGVRIPLFYKNKQKLGITESAHNVTRAQKELEAIRQETAFNIRNEYLQMQSSEKLLSLFEEAIMPQSKLTLESSVSSYQVGKADFLTTISNFMRVLDYRINYVEELAKHESAVARLEEALGHPLANALPQGDPDHE